MAASHGVIIWQLSQIPYMQSSTLDAWKANRMPSAKSAIPQVPFPYPQSGRMSQMQRPRATRSACFCVPAVRHAAHLPLHVRAMLAYPGKHRPKSNQRKISYPSIGLVYHQTPTPNVGIRVRTHKTHTAVRHFTYGTQTRPS